MKIKLVTIVVLTISILNLACKGSQKEDQKAIDQQVEAIQAVEESIDSTIAEVNRKTEEVEQIIKELDSL